MDELLLAADRIDAGYGDHTVVRGISLQIEKGARVFLVGLNASGKSTLLRALFGVLPIRAPGWIRVGDRLASRWGPRDYLRAGVALVPQEGRLFGGLTVVDNLEISADFHRVEGSQSARISESFAAFPILYGLRNRRAASLSGGEQQLLSLAIALVHRPRLLLLDEPFSGLDGHRRATLRSHLLRLNQQLGVTLLVAEHLAREVEALASTVVALRRGEVTGRLTQPEYIHRDAIRCLLLPTRSGGSGEVVAGESEGRRD